VEIGGHELAVMIRGHSVDNPVLLFLAGGPGGTELGAMRRHLPALEQDFVVVTYDQRGTGKSYEQLDPTSTLTFDAAVSDVLEVTNYLRDRFGQDQIYLVGQSWGTTLGVVAVQRQPQLFHAYIGTGQMVSQRATDQIYYQDTLAWAEQTGDRGLVDRLTQSGPPPYDNILYYEQALSHAMDMYPYDHSQNSEGEGQFSESRSTTSARCWTCSQLCTRRSRTWTSGSTPPASRFPSTWCKAATRHLAGPYWPTSGSPCWTRQARR
jgi:pimeloyl-ACP methyl ester carboxylesterase